MNICPEQLFRLLYHPVAYTHCSHLPHTWRTDEQTNALLLNYWLHTHYQLAHLPETWVASDPLIIAIIQQWYRLPNISHLLGGYLLKSSMLNTSSTLFSDPQLLTFIALPMVHQADIAIQKHGKHTTQACGAAFILSQCNSMPQALHQRFMLLFPADIVLPTMQAPRTPDHINLFNMATHYANCFPGRAA